MKNEVIVGVVVAVITAALVILGQLFIQLSSNTLSASIIETLANDDKFIRAVELKLNNDKRLEKKLVLELRKDIGAQMFPEKSIITFGLKECPKGWEEYTPAYGRFIRGIDKTGKIDPDGVRVPGATQEDTFKKHGHSLPREVWSFKGAGSNQNPTDSKGGAGVTTTNDSGGEESRPKNVALLYCMKI